jgi:tripartite-type tricarboxylate transporter receptor subunit TctC
MMKRRTLLSVTAAAASSLLLPAALSQTAAYPNKPIKMIVPYAAGISPDIVARLIGNKLSIALGQPIIIDNRPGAGGMIGAEFAAAAPGDGYNLFFTVKGVMAIAPHLYPNAKYNALKDFKAVSQILLVPHIITATPNAPYNTLKEMVEYAKKNPGKINFASAGVGSQPHVALEAWAKRMGIKLNHIPYKSNPGPDVMSGVVDIYLEASTTAIPSIQAGKIKALAVSGSERIPALPNVPTVTEFGANLDPNGVIGNSWHGIYTPVSTPDDIVNKLNAEIIKIVNMPDIQARLKSLGLTPTGTNAATLSNGAASDFAYWGALIKELGITVE